jgi:hypothetical protein
VFACTSSVGLLATVSALLCLSMVSPSTAAADNFLTQSERLLCAVTPDSTISISGEDAVVCQGEFDHAPELGAGAVTNGDGTFRWEVGNLSIYSSTTNMQYGHTYHRGNWSIYHADNGTRFTNDRTGHGMFVSIESVYAF